MGLREYKKKRDFRRTREPAGTNPETSASRGARSRGLRYLIQKHAASRLHYDFRLEWDGVLKSWAVPKGPSLNPHERRLAVHVEDHPIEYGKFEGTIPKGEYGGGTVMLWDRGTWYPVEDAARGLRKGRLKFLLDGERLQGGWMLVQMRGPRSEDGKNWLLIKERDEAAVDAGGEEILEETKSVTTGRTMEEIASGVRPRRRKSSAAVAKPRAKRQVKIVTAAKSGAETVPRDAERSTAGRARGALRPRPKVSPQI